MILQTAKVDVIERDSDKHFKVSLGEVSCPKCGKKGILIAYLSFPSGSYETFIAHLDNIKGNKICLIS